jgi:hypothetical protein
MDPFVERAEKHIEIDILKGIASMGNRRHDDAEH